MNVTETRWCWRKDLREFPRLSAEDKMGYLLVLEWFENFRLRHELEAGRESAKIFWKNEVKGHGRERESWQLTQWEAAIHWYLRWLGACVKAEAGHESLAERVRIAVRSAGVRRGLAPRTQQAYSSWAARYAAFAGSASEVLALETATRFLTLVIEDRGCAF